jgi:hypothetical protein
MLGVLKKDGKKDEESKMTLSIEIECAWMHATGSS